MFMKHYAPNRCEPSIEALNFGGGGGRVVGRVGGGGGLGGGGPDKCERRIEVFVKIQNKKWGGGDRVGGRLLSFYTF